MKRTEWRTLMIVRALGERQPAPFNFFGGRVAVVTREAQDAWKWEVRDNYVTRPRFKGVVKSRHYAIVCANRAAARLGWVKWGSGLPAVSP